MVFVVVSEIGCVASESKLSLFCVAVHQFASCYAMIIAELKRLQINDTYLLQQVLLFFVSCTVHAVHSDHSCYLQANYKLISYVTWFRHDFFVFCYCNYFSEHYQTANQCN